MKSNKKRKPRVFKVLKTYIGTTPRPKNEGKKLNKQRFASRMRANPTPTEKLMFDLLTEAKIPFKPQPVMLGYIPDCYVSSAKLIIEVDGVIHDSQKAYDAFRDSVFRKKGFEVLRIKSDRLIANPQGVLTEVKRAVILNQERVQRLRNDKRNEKRRLAIEAKDKPPF